MATTRTCGECAACCTADPVSSNDPDDVVRVHKPAGQPCPLQAHGATPAQGSCLVHANKPRCCAIYRCEWLNGDGADDERPDLSGVITEAARDERGEVRIAVLLPSPGFDERSPGFVRAAHAWHARGAIVLSPSLEYINDEQLAWLRNVEMRFADGNVLRVPADVGEHEPERTN